MNYNSTYSLLKKAIWIYIILLIFEGALRKWILPGLATPLLIVRDPLAIFILYIAIHNRIIEWNIWLISIVIITFISSVSSIYIGHGNIWVLFYGIRLYLIHFPLIFVIGNVLTKKDIRNVGIFFLSLTVPMVILNVMQFNSPATAWVNIGIGGEGTSGFSGALGHLRPPGTFSFTNGNVLYWGVVQVFICYFLLNTNEIPKWLLMLSVVSLAIAIPTSVSRTLFFMMFVALFFMFLALSQRPKLITNIILGSIAIFIVLFILSILPIFQTATEAFTARFENASSNEGGVEGVLVDRYLGGMVGAIANGGDFPIMGYGIGLGTQAGSQMAYGYKKFTISEGEWGRMVGEQGVFLGLLLILVRLTLAVFIFIQAFKQIKTGNTLGIILCGMMLLQLPQGQWSQPTILGFTTLIAGLTLASVNKNELK